MKKRILIAAFAAFAMASCASPNPTPSAGSSAPAADSSNPAAGSSAGEDVSASTPGTSGEGQTSMDDSAAAPTGEAYQIYRLYVAEGGDMTYEEWLASIKGADGASLLGGESDPDATMGKNGDTYVNTSSWDVFVKSGGAWIKVGNIMGPKGQDGRDAYSCTILPSEHGYMTVNVGSAFVGEDITFIACPDAGYILSHLYLNDVDVIDQMTDKTQFTTKMVKNGFVVRGLFEVNRRVSDEVFRREVTNRSFLYEPAGFSLRYVADVFGPNYKSATTYEVQKSGNVIHLATTSGYSKYEVLFVGENDEPNCDAFRRYSRSYYSDEWNKWSLYDGVMDANSVWSFVIPGFYEFSALEYAYNPNNGFYETSAESISLGPDIGLIGNFTARFGFQNDRVSDFSFRATQTSYDIEVEGTLFDYDGKTTIDETFVADAIDEATRMNVTIWVGDSLEIGPTLELIDEFKKDNPDYNFDVSVTCTHTGYIMDYSVTADVFCYAQDQLNRLISRGDLSPLDADAQGRVSAANNSASVEGATFGGTMYGYPMSADNGYFMYYDKTVVSPSHATDLSAILNDCVSSSRFFFFEGNSAWYTASFFMGAGCTSTWQVDEKGDFVSCVDNYYSPEGVEALMGLSQVLTSDVYVNGAANSLSSSAGVVISGTWDYEELKELWGSNLACAPLPSYTANGSKHHMGSFLGCKYIGVRPQEDETKTALCHKIAEYLSSYKAQMRRLQELGFGPSNLAALESPEAKSNPALQAFAAQMEYSVVQGQYPGDWWEIAGRVISNEVRWLGSHPSYEDLQSILSEYNDSINFIAPNQSPNPVFPPVGGGGDQEEEEEFPTSGYGLLIEGHKPVVATPFGEPDYAGREQYLIKAQSFTAGQEFILFDFEYYNGWVIDIDPYSFKAEGKTAIVSQYVVKGNGCYTVVKDFVADIYIKLKPQDDQIFFLLVD